MGISVKIGGVDKTEYVDARTLSIRDELTSKVNSASFDFICNDVAVAPIPGEEVLIEEGANKLFSGRILSKQESFLPPNLLKYPVECIDHTRDLDKKLVFESYKNQKAGDIVKDIINKYTTYSVIPTGYNDPDSEWTDETLAYDGYIDTYAERLQIIEHTWTTFIEFTHASMLCKGIHFLAWNDIDYTSHEYRCTVDIDAYYGETWNHVYEGVYANREWVEKLLASPQYVTAFRFRFYNNKSITFDAWLYEVNFIPSDIFTTINVSDGPTISEIAFDYVQVSDAITKIAEICGYEWYVDYDRDIHFFAKNTYPAPFQLDDNQADYKDLIIDTDVSQIRNRIFVKSSNIKDFVGEAFVADGVSTKWNCMFKAENLPLTFLTSSFPLGATATKIQFSHNDVYLAVGYTKYHCLKIWKREGDEFTALSFFSTTPDTDVFAVAWSSDDIYLAAVYDAGSKIRVWKRDNDNFTALGVFANLPAGIANDVQFSPYDTYLAAVNDGTPYIIIYKRAGDIFTKLSNPADLPAGDGNGVGWSPDGVYLAVAHDTSPFITIYKRSGDTFAKLGNPTNLPTGNGNSISWSPDGIYLAVAHATTPFITIYKRNGDTFTKITNPDDLPTGDANDVDFSADGMQLAVGHDITPFLTVYKHTADLFIKQDDPEDLPDDNVRGVDFSSSSIYLAVGCKTFHYLTVYKQYPLTIKVDGVIKTIGWDGIDNPLYFDFILNEQTKVLSIGTAEPEEIDIGLPAVYGTITKIQGYTYIIGDNPANATGKITSVEIYAYQDLVNCKVAIFQRISGNIFSTRDYVNLGTVTAGAKRTIAVSLNVVIGDYIGIYFSSGLIHCNELSEGAGFWDLNADKIPCTNVTFGHYGNRQISLYGTGSEWELTIGSEILVGYYSIGAPICLRRDDQDSIDAIKAIEGGDGIVEFCITDNNIDNIVWASEVAKADLLKNANSAIKATFITNRSDIKSGQIITLNSTKRNINQQFIVQKIELIRVDVIEYYGTAEVPYKPVAEAVIGYKPAAEAEVPYKPADGGGEIIYYIFNVTIANKFRKLEDLFIYLLNRTNESLK